MTLAGRVTTNLLLVLRVKNGDKKVRTAYNQKGTLMNTCKITQNNYRKSGDSINETVNDA